MNRFVEGRAHNGRVLTPPLGQTSNNVRPDRSSAQTLKFSKKSGNTALTNTDPAPPYASNQFDDRNTVPHNQYQQVEYGQGIDDFKKEARYHKDTLEETTVGSDFDRTKSDIGFEPEQYDEYNDGGFSGDEDNGYVHPERRPYVEHAGSKEVHTIQYKQSRSPLVGTKTGHHTQRQQPLAIAGRFEANKQHQDLQLRNGHGDSDPYRGQGSRKRSRSRDAPHAPVTRGLGQEIPDDDDEDDLEFPGGQPDATIRLADVQICSDGTEQATPVPSPARQRKSRMIPQVPSSQNLQDPQNPHSQENLGIDDRLIPDYSDEQLKHMKYSDLEGENWDMVPHAKPYKLPDALQGRKVTLEKKIEYHLKLDPEQGQLPFYENLSTEEWEQAGDLFIEKFAELMKKLKAKKQGKRQTASQFENEIKEREKVIRDHASRLDKQLEGMEVAGKSLLGKNKKKG